MILYTISAVTAIFAAYLSFQVDEESRFRRDRTENVAVAVSIDSGKDGGAAGFAILSGLALVAASITYLRKDD
ncbi:MAG: hypothetical protein ACOCUT_04005 [bacterium]